MRVPVNLQWIVFLMIPAGLLADPIAVTFTGAGPFTFTPLSATSLVENQLLTFTASSPFDLVSAVYQGDLDLTLPFPSRLSNSSFQLTALDGDLLLGTYTIQTSQFSDATHEAFSGTYTFTGGTGEFAGATGGGTYTGESVFQTQLSGTSTLDASGLITLAPEPSSFVLLSSSVAAALAARLWRRRSLRR